MDRDQLKELVWEVVKDAMFVHSEQKIQKKDLKKETRALDVFPTHESEHPYYDEYANAYGVAIISAWLYFNVEYGLDLKLDYEVRKEFELFPKLEDVSRYIYSKFGPIIIGGVNK